MMNNNKKIKVLIVDNHFAIGVWMKSILKKNQKDNSHVRIKVKSADLDKSPIHYRRYNIIVVDITLNYEKRQKSGFDIIKEIKKARREKGENTYKKIGIIIQTRHINPYYILRAKELEVDGYLYKEDKVDIKRIIKDIYKMKNESTIEDIEAGKNTFQNKYLSKSVQEKWKEINVESISLTQEEKLILHYFNKTLKDESFADIKNLRKEQSANIEEKHWKDFLNFLNEAENKDYISIYKNIINEREKLKDTDKEKREKFDRMPDYLLGHFTREIKRKYSQYKSDNKIKNLSPMKNLTKKYDSDFIKLLQAIFIKIGYSTIPTFPPDLQDKINELGYDTKDLKS